MTDIDVIDIIVVRYIPEIEYFLFDVKTARMTDIDVIDIIVVKYLPEIEIYV